MKTLLYDILNRDLKDIEYFKQISFDEDKFNPIFFDNIKFHKYHEKNANQVYRVLNIKKNKIIAFYFFGIKDEEMFMPYSSPFSQIIFKDEKYSYNDINFIIQGMIFIANHIGIKSINISLPPFIYDKEIESQFLMFINNGFNINYIDINHYFDLNEFNTKEELVSSLPYNQRKHYKRVNKKNLKFYKLDNNKFEEAFEIIEINRSERGYPLKMDREQIKDILEFNNSNIDFFIIEDENKNKIASAMVYKVNDEVYQVIYWGHISQYSQDRPMSKLSTSMYEYYKKMGIKYLDIGPSSENGKINTTLSQFKIDIGCKNISKFSLVINL